jgi:signal transduction histidine kinase/ActR/RegA family two-component response regulator
MTRRRWRRFSRVNLVSLALPLLTSVAAGPSSAQEPPHWRTFTSTDGLRESWVEDVTQGPSGRVWITHGSVDSLTVFDGYTVRRLPSPGLVVKLREGPTGQVWGLLPNSAKPFTYTGLQLLEGERWTAFPLDAIRDGELTRSQFLPWENDRILFLTASEILEFDRGSRTVRVVRRAVDTQLARFTDLAPANDGGAWISGPGGLLHLRRPGASSRESADRALKLPATWRARRIVNVHDTGKEVFASLDLDGTWAAVAFDGATWREIARTTASGESIHAWRGRGDEIWIAFISPNGFRLTTQSGECCRRELGRTKAFSGRFNAVEPLSDGGFWLATSLGLVRHAPAAWYSPPQLATLGGFGGLLESSTGDLYALHNEGLVRRNGGRWEMLRVPAGFAVDRAPARNIAELPDGRIVFGTLVANNNDATLAFEPARSQFTEIRHPAGRRMRVVGPRAEGGAWMVTSARDHHWLEHYDGRDFTQVLDVQSAWVGSPPRTIVELGGGDLLIVPDAGGVGWVRKGTREVIGPAQGYLGSGSFAALQFGRNLFWIGDRDSVLSFDGRGWHTLRTGLQTVRAITRTRDGSVWVTSGSGLHRFLEGSWTTIAAPEGLPDGSAHHLLEERSGSLWVSTTAGLSRYIGEADRDPPESSLDTPGNPTEAPPSGDVSVAFSGRDRWNYSLSDRLLYSWRLDGGAWSHFESRAAVALQGLRPGEHRLEVRAADRNWNVDASPAALDLVVLLPWYRESGFLAMGALASVAVLFAVGLFVSRHVRLERLVSERTTELAAAITQLRAELADRQRAEQERALLERQLNQAQKLEAVGRLAGGIAHDFNNLLTVIIGFAQFAREEVPTGAAVAGSLDEVLKAAERAATLTRQLMAFSRQQIVEPRPLDLNVVVADIERMLRRLIGEDIALTFVPGADLWVVQADRGQIEQVIVNLAVNGRDAMPEGGQLTIETSNVELDEAFVRAHAGTRIGPHVLLAVSDSGFGMDAETRARIFEPFFTTKAREKGSGLGLATVYGIVTQANGHVWVESEPGQGTTFKIYLPRTDAALADMTTAATSQARRGSETILLVEDDPAVRQIAGSTLQRLGYNVEVVSSGEAALARLRERNNWPDLVLTDVVLTGMSGPEFAKHARQLRSTLRVLFMSGHVDAAMMRRGPLTAGAHMIQKPFTAEALSRKVREALDAPPLP